MAETSATEAEVRAVAARAREAAAELPSFPGRVVFAGQPSDADLAALPARRAPHRPLLPRCWELRDNLTIYDAVYVALAEAMNTTLLTGDEKLARAPGPQLVL